MSYNVYKIRNLQGGDYGDYTVFFKKVIQESFQDICMSELQPNNRQGAAIIFQTILTSQL